MRPFELDVLEELEFLTVPLLEFLTVLPFVPLIDLVPFRVYPLELRVDLLLFVATVLRPLRVISVFNLDWFNRVTERPR